MFYFQICAEEMFTVFLDVLENTLRRCALKIVFITDDLSELKIKMDKEKNKNYCTEKLTLA